VLTEHQAGVCLDMPRGGIRVRGRKSTPGRYFQVANPGTGWGGTDITEPLTMIRSIDPEVAWPGMRVLLTTTTGEDSLWCILDDDRARCWSILKLHQVLQHGAVVLIQPDMSELDHWSSELSLVSTNCSTSPAISMARDESV